MGAGGNKAGVAACLVGASLPGAARLWPNRLFVPHPMARRHPCLAATPPAAPLGQAAAATLLCWSAGAPSASRRTSGECPAPIIVQAKLARTAVACRPALALCHELTSTWLSLPKLRPLLQ